MSGNEVPRIAILASGGGTTAEAFIQATQSGIVDAEVGLVVCNNPREKAGVWDRVDRLNEQYGLDIQTVHISGKTHPDPEGTPIMRGQTIAESQAIYDLLKDGDYSLVALMGYMKVTRGKLQEAYGWSPLLNSKYEARMINTHPGPLPETGDTYGSGASQRVLDLGMAQSRHTVHLVSSGVDEGPILAENFVDVLPGDSADSLFQRVQLAEKAMLPVNIKQFLREQRAYREDNEAV